MKWDHMTAQSSLWLLPRTKPFLCQHLSDKLCLATVGNLTFNLIFIASNK